LFTFLRKKGGDPATPSGTATLLRLNPLYQPFLRTYTDPSGKTNSGGVTGGVYKDRERIHRSMADLRLLAIPASCRRVSAYNPN
jgi:hypothetical protein